MMSAIEDVEGDTVVAIVGAGHVAGMTRYFGQPIDREPLKLIPPPKTWVQALKWIIPMLILAAFAWGYYRNDWGTLEEMITAWVLPNSIMAALFTLAAGARFTSIVTAFIASPITSLNPLLPCGVVVGLTEAWLRRPTVEDAEKINEDVQSLGGIYKNTFTRVLLVAMMATFGSAAGAWIGIPLVFSLLPS
jgi:pheromone shutdown protein TraB